MLNLSETTYNRRYIAYSRRARALWRLGKHDAALRDIDAILVTADIVMEQKMAARLQRAQWLMSTAPASAIADVETVIASVRNFPEVAEDARLLLDQVRESGPDGSGPPPEGTQVGMPGTVDVPPAQDLAESARPG